MPFTPGDPWPSSSVYAPELGSVNPAWGGYVRLLVQASIPTGGKAFTVGPHANAELDSGNVLSQAGGLPAALWIDLTCDLIDLSTTYGAGQSDGILSKVEAATLDVTLFDPTGKYDPFNSRSPLALAGSSRLVAGVPIRAIAEVIDDPAADPVTVTAYGVFTGTADQWSEPWVSFEGERFAKLVATDATKLWAKFNQPAVAAVGAGETSLTRLNRIRTHFGATQSITQFGTSSITLAATTLAQTAWELANRVADDELGFLFFPPFADSLVICARSVWSSAPLVAIIVGCDPDPGSGEEWFDIATEVAPASIDALLLNAAYVARTGGTVITYKSNSSIAQWGEQSLNRTDLGLQTDGQVITWAQDLIGRTAHPSLALDHVVMEPAAAAAGTGGPVWTAWKNVLKVALVTGAVRVVWDQAGYDVDVTCRVIGVRHRVTADQWAVTWQTIPV